MQRTSRAVTDAAVDLLLEEGWDRVTHARVAAAAGCSKVTVYAHWPTRVDLLRDAFTRLSEAAHHEPTGDTRHDLAAELRAFRRELVDRRLDRVLAVLADRAVAVPELRDVRARLVADGERTLRQIVGRVATGPRAEAGVLMLCGAMVHATLLHGRAPDDETIGALVGVVLDGLVRPDP